MERLKGDSWKWFEDALNDLAPSSKGSYLTAFIGFLEWGEYDTESLFKEHLANSRAEDPRAIKRIPLKVVQYQKHLMRDKGKSSMTATTVEKAIKKFFDSNELPFKITGEKIKVETEEIPNITDDQLRMVLNASGNYKVKAFILFAKDSGLRLGDITRLPIKKVRAAIEDPEVKYYTFEWKTQKTGKTANPVIGFETIAALRTWMNHRINVLKLSAENDDPLFCMERSRAAYVNSRGIEIKETKKGDWMGNSNMGVLFARLVKKAGIEPDIDGKLPSIHSCRKYHKTNLESGGCPTSWVNRMQGRKGSGTGGTYTKPDSGQLIAIYRKAYSALEIYGTAVIDELERTRREAIIAFNAFCRARGERPQGETLLNFEAMLKKAKNPDEVETVVNKWYDMRLKIKGGLPEFMYISKLVTEEELPDYLDRGFDITGTVPSGKIAVKRIR